MTLFRNVVFTAALAGLLAGIVMTAMQAYATVPLILQAEVFENAGAEAAPAHGHGASVDAPFAGADAAAPGSAHSHAAAAEEESWEPSDGIERYSFTILANIVTAMGWALLLVAASEVFGGIADWRHGLMWGLAGFVVFTLAPGLGLPPELPAMPAADLTQRQIWWVCTAVATAAGLVLIFLRGSPLPVVLGIGLLVAPHLLGAPQPVGHETPIPENLHHRFVVAVTVTNLLFWAVLGIAVGVARQRFLADRPVLRQSLA